MAGSRGVVIAALIANGAIAVVKFLGFLVTGSPSMLSETYHSISDTGNQVFLLIGLRFSAKEPSAAHPFGYGKAQFFYAFLVSVLLFGIAGWESAKHGVNAITHAGGHAERTDVVLAGVNVTELVPVELFWVNVVVLSGAVLFEAWAFRKAYAELDGQIDEFGWSGIPEAFRKTSDVTTLTAFTEDAIAGGGAAIALLGVVLARVTGAEIFDAVAALLIGLLLMGFAVALAWENKRLLLGESTPPDVEDALRERITSRSDVVGVSQFRSMYVGPKNLLVAVDVRFAPDMDAEAIDAAIADIETALHETDSRVGFVYVEPEV